MKERNDWQAFYRQQVQRAERLHQNLHRLPEVLPPRIRIADRVSGSRAYPVAHLEKEIKQDKEIQAGRNETVRTFAKSCP